ncbi:MAG TPA: PilZ domain-containing protein, partial [Chloroflexota bacterium]
REEIAWVTIVWSVANAAILLLGLRSVLRRSYQRQTYRFPAHLTAELTHQPGPMHFATVDDLSANGAGLVVSSRLEIKTGDRIDATISWPGGKVPVRGLVTHLRPLAGDRLHVGMQFVKLSVEEREGLLECLYVSTARDQAALLAETSSARRTRRASWAWQHWGNLVSGERGTRIVIGGAGSGAD